MKRITALMFAGMIMVSLAFAQTTPPATAAAPAGGGFQRPPLTPEQEAANKARAEAREADHQNMMDQLHIKTLRPGKSGTAGQPNYANYDEAKANPYPNLPDPLTFKNSKKVTTAKEWWKRREEIKEDFDREVYGRVPKNVPSVTWTVVKDTTEIVEGIPVLSKRIVGHVDNSLFPQENVDIQLTLSTPANATGPVPVIMQFGGNGYPRAAAHQPEVLAAGCLLLVARRAPLLKHQKNN